MAWAQSTDVTARWIGDDVPATATIDVYIEDAETLIASEYADVDARIADVDDALTLPRVVMVVSRMVIRALKNPENARVDQQQTGPFGRTLTYAGDNPGGLYLSDDDRSLLGGTAAATSQRGFTINTTPAATRDEAYGYWSTASTWVPLAP